MEKKLVIIGGGPAGLAAAASARAAGVEDILILERDARLGGILNQCIHNGFGLHTFKEELTGPEYALRYIEKVKELEIEYWLNTMVIDLSQEENGKKLVTVMNLEKGLVTIEAEAVILAMGCRERPRGALNIPGYRPAGIYSAGTAPEICQHGGAHARQGGCHFRLRGYRADYGKAYDPGGGEGKAGGGADALFRGLKAEYCAMPGRFRDSLKAEPHRCGY